MLAKYCCAYVGRRKTERLHYMRMMRTNAHRLRGLGSDPREPLIATVQAGAWFCSLMFAKALGTQQNKKKSIVMLKAVLGIVPRSVAFLPACRWAFSCSCNLRRAQQHSVIA